MYKSFVLPKIEFSLPPIYNLLHAGQAARLEGLQSMAARIILPGRRVSNALRYEKMGVKPIGDRARGGFERFVTRAHKTGWVDEWLEAANPVRDTRFAPTYNVPRCRTERCKNSPHSLAAIALNRIIAANRASA